MKFLESNSMYVRKDGFVYRVYGYNACDGDTVLELKLSLVAGWDYLNPDENDDQGWCPASRFTDDVQTDMVIMNFRMQGAEDALRSDGYEILSSSDYCVIQNL